MNNYNHACGNQIQQNQLQNVVPPQQQPQQQQHQQMVADVTINKLIYENRNLQHYNFDLNDKVNNLENELVKQKNKEGTRFVDTDYVFENPQFSILMLLNSNRNVIQQFANGKIVDVFTLKHDPRCDTEDIHYFNVKVMNDENLKPVRLPESKICPKCIIKSFRDQAGMTFSAKRSDVKNGEFLCNYLSPLIDAGEKFYVPFNCGWNSKSESTKFLYHGSKDSEISVPPFIKRSLEVSTNILKPYSLVEKVLDLFFEAFNQNSLVVPLIIFIWLHFSIMFSLYHEEGITVNKILALSGDNNLCKDILRKLLCYFSKSQSIIALNTPLEIIKSEIHESKDEVLIFTENHVAKTKVEIEKVMINKCFIVNMFSEGNSFELDFSTENTKQNIYVSSTAAVATNAMFYEMPADKFIRLHIDCDDINIPLFKKLMIDNNCLQQYVVSFVGYIGSDILNVKAKMKASYLDFVDDKKFEFEQASTKETFAVLTTTIDIIEMYYEDNNLNIKEIIKIDYKEEIYKLLSANEASYDIDGIAESFKDTIIKLIESGKAFLIDNNKATADTTLQIDKNGFNIYHDREFIFIGLYTLKKWVIPEMQMHIKANSILHALRLENAIKLYDQQKESFESRVMIYAGNTEPQRKSMIKIHRTFLESDGTLPII